MPFALSAMYVFNDWLGVSASWTLSSYVTFTTQLLAAFGLAFELPMVLLILGRMGIISGEWLRVHRRHAIVVNLTIACILTPPDVVSQIIMTIPLVLMYEGCIWLVCLWDRNKALTTGVAETDHAPIDSSSGDPS